MMDQATVAVSISTRLMGSELPEYAKAKYQNFHTDSQLKKKRRLK
jgi:ribosomal protein S19